MKALERRATRALMSLKGLCYSERLQQLGLPTLEYRRARADVIEVYKLINELDKTAIKLLSLSEITHTRGHNFKLYKPRARLNIRKNTFSHRVIDQWNSLPSEVAEAKSLNSFKSRLNKYWKIPNKFEANCYKPY